MSSENEDPILRICSEFLKKVGITGEVLTQPAIAEASFLGEKRVTNNGISSNKN
jgi:hypothetical protein